MRKCKAGLITSVEIFCRASASTDGCVGRNCRRRNGFLQTLRCCAREIGDRTEKTSCQNVDVCRRVQNHLSNREAGEKLAYVRSSASQNSPAALLNWAQPQEMPFLASNPCTHKRFLEGA